MMTYQMPSEVGGYEEFGILMNYMGQGYVEIRFQGVASRAGEERGEFRLPVTRDQVEQALAVIWRTSQGYATRKGPQEGEEILWNIGRSLFSTLFEGRREGLYRGAQEIAARNNRGLRLHLQLDNAELAAMPWEFLHDGRDFIALSDRSPVVRSLVKTLPSPPPAKSSPPGMLTVITTSPDQPFLEQEEMLLKELERNFSQLKSLKPLKNPTLQVLAETIAKHNFEILHFIGQGVEVKPGYQALWLREESSDSVLVEAEQLKQMLAPKKDLQLIYLNAPYSDLLAFELAKVCPGTLGIRSNITRAAANAFSESLLHSLLEGKSLEAAVTQGRQLVNLNQAGSQMWGLPVLYLDLESQLFVPSRTTATPEALVSPEQQRLEKLITIRRRNLQVLEEQVGSVKSVAPASIQLQIETLRQEIADLEQKKRET